MNNQPGASVVSMQKHRDATFSNDSSVSKKSDAQEKSPSLKEGLDFIRDDSINALLELLKSMFDGIDDSFFELANSSRNNNEQNRYFEAMREVRVKRKGIETEFINQLQRYFKHPPTKKSFQFDSFKEDSGNSSGFESLSLVQNEDLEEDVAIKTMSGKAFANFQESLIQIEARFREALNQEEILSPLAPELISKSFANACDILDLEIREKLIIYKQFDRFVLSNMREILEVCNLRLIKLGILPDLRYKSSKPRASAKTTSTHSDFIHNTASDEHGARNQGTSNLSSGQATFSLNDIRQLLHAASSKDTSSNLENATQGNFIADEELLSMLSRIQVPYSESELLSAPVQLVDIRAALQALVDKENATSDEKINQLDEDLINLVSMLFEFILDDYNLSAPIQVLISRLQIPLLKVVIHDNSFFNNAQHPARQLLNALAKAGIGWGESSEKQKDRLYNKIHQIVHRILNEFDGNVGLFEELNQEFSEFMKKEDRKSSIIEQRTKEAEKGRIKSQKAQQAVEKAIRQRFESNPLPNEAKDIIQTGWSRVMFLSYLKEDNQQSWNKSLRVLDELAWCLTPKSKPEDRQRWVKVVPLLLKEIRNGLQNLSYNSARLEEMISQLKDLLTSTFKQQVSAPKPRPAAPPEPKKPLTAVQKQKELEDSLVQEYLEQVDALKEGSWIEFTLVNGSHFRCKLSAHIDDGNCLIFVNRMGLKVVEKTRNELAHELRKGRVRVLEQGLLFDRALNSVISGLRKKSAGAA